MMELSWIQEHWFELLRTVAEIGGFIYAIRTLREEIKIKKLDCEFRLTKHHREIWSEIYPHPELSHIENAEVDLATHPITIQERLFVRFVILHTKNAYRASRAGFYQSIATLRKDATDFFSRPIPKAVWAETGIFHDDGFRTFIEKSNPVQIDQ